MGFPIKVWGPSLWELIHIVALGYDNFPITKERINYYNLFFNTITKIIPCIKCKIHYYQYLRRRPVIKYLKNSDSLLRWVNDLHNSVNRKLRKK